MLRTTHRQSLHERPVASGNDGLSVSTAKGDRGRLIWHMSRQSLSQPPFSPHNIATGLKAGAICEVDVHRCKDGFVLLHGSKLEDSTTGKGNVADLTKAEI